MRSSCRSQVRVPYPHTNPILPHASLLRNNLIPSPLRVPRVQHNIEEYRCLRVMPHQRFSKKVYDRIIEARCSPIYLASIDLFVGPIIGRYSSMAYLQLLSQEMGAPASYQMSQPLLVIRGVQKTMYGKLMVVSGGHGLLLASLVKHLHFLPYQVIDVRDLEEFGNNLHMAIHEPILAYHVETTNPRPAPYDIMQQVGLFGRLKEYWVWQEQQRILESGKKMKMSAMTQNKLLATYADLREDAEGRHKFAIGFIEDSPADPTKKGYMTGAERLLKADVLEDLCYLEATGPTRFNKSSLNTVRNWSVQKIKNTVALWVARRKSGFPFTCVFSDTAGNETDGKKRGRKRRRSENESPRLKDPPPGWEDYLNWEQIGTMTLVDQLEGKVKEEVDRIKKEAVKNSGPGTIALDVGEDKLEVLSLVREELKEKSKRGKAPKLFDLADLVTRAVVKLDTSKYSDVATILNGSVLQKTFTLWNEDSSRIEKLSMATDEAVVFTLYFLNNWSTQTMNDIYILDSAYLSGWFEKPYHTLAKSNKEQLRDKVGRYKRNTVNPHDAVWETQITMLPICGNNHWSLAVVCSLPTLFNELENQSSSPIRNVSSQDNANATKARLYWLDSMGPKQSLHQSMAQNLIEFLCACYPGKRELTAQALKERLSFDTIRKPLQTNVECGFYVTYHASLVCRDTAPFLSFSPNAAQRYLEGCYGDYTFRKYTNDIHKRLRAFKTMYRANPTDAAPARTFHWPIPPVPKRSTTSSSNAHDSSRLAIEGPSVSAQKTNRESTETTPNVPAAPYGQNEKSEPANKCTNLGAFRSDEKKNCDPAEAPPSVPAFTPPSSQPSRCDIPFVGNDNDDFMPHPSHKKLKRDLQITQLPNAPSQMDFSQTVIPVNTLKPPMQIVPPISSQNKISLPLRAVPDPSLPVRKALIGVLNGLLSLDMGASPSPAKSDVIRAVLDTSEINKAIRESRDPANMESYLTLLTPMAVKRYRELQIVAFNTTKPTLSTAVPGPVAGPSLVRQRGSPTAVVPTSVAMPDIVVEGISLAKQHKDKHLREEWERCMARARDLLSMMKCQKQG
ncbi:Ulp1 protease [Gracilaria domingensis]|nr:Ulp1 protease [Gracilaria domingensis]KAI0558429.1 Ulp1 protease [Gracilaria domingensis]